MRIAIAVCNFLPYRAGITNVAARHAAHLRTAGHEVVVLCPAHDHQIGPTTIEGTRVTRLRQIGRHGNSAIVPGIWRQLRGFDALYLHYPFYGGAELAAASAHWYRIPVVTFFHMDVFRDGFEGKILWLYERSVAPRLLRGCERVFVSSLDYARSASISRYGLENLEEFPYAVDTDRYRPGEIAEDELRRLGIDPSRPIVLFVGAMDRGHAFKGVPELIAAAAVAGLADRAQLVLVGDGELRRGFEERASAELGPAGACFVGRVSEEDLRLLYRAARVTVLPSTTGEEAFGIVLIESLASGTPVIASALPGVRTIVNGDTGWLVPPGDVRELAARLSDLVDGPDNVQVIRRSARELAVEHFSHQREAEQLAAAFAAIETPSLRRSRLGLRRRR